MFSSVKLFDGWGSILVRGIFPFATRSGTQPTPKPVGITVIPSKLIKGMEQEPDHSLQKLI